MRDGLKRGEVDPYSHQYAEERLEFNRSIRDSALGIVDLLSETHHNTSTCLDILERAKLMLLNRSYPVSMPKKDSREGAE